jgi:hypothetical protein
MPWSESDVDKHNKGLSPQQKKQWVAVANSALKKCQSEGGKDCEKHAIMQANGAVKRSDLEEFSLTIKKAYFDEKTNEMRWRADTSDTESDSYDDSMTIELFNDFIDRITKAEQPPEQFKSDFWDGGMPYISVSHYRDQNGKAVPGTVENIYVDGNVLKAKGTFSDTPLGRACFKSVCESIHAESDKPKVRVSIAFLDYKHEHKSSGVIYERKSVDAHCKECFRELASQLVDGVKPGGKNYLRGHLIHLAMTRVPVNKRTAMEVDKSMTTQIEDAESIIGEELAKELEEQEKALIGKSEALVVKAEADKCSKCGKDLVDGKCPDCDAEEKKSDVYDFARLEGKIDQLLSLAEVQTKPEHKLDEVFTQFRSDFDSVLLSDTTPEEKLQTLQPAINAVGDKVVELVRAESKPISPEKKQEDTLTQLSNVVANLAEKVELMSTQLENAPKTINSVVTVPAIPERRSINPASVSPSLLAKKSNSETPKLRALVDRSVGL